MDLARASLTSSLCQRASSSQNNLVLFCLLSDRNINNNCLVFITSGKLHHKTMAALGLVLLIALSLFPRSILATSPVSIRTTGQDAKGVIDKTETS